MAKELLKHTENDKETAYSMKLPTRTRNRIIELLEKEHGEQVAVTFTDISITVIKNPSNETKVAIQKFRRAQDDSQDH